MYNYYEKFYVRQNAEFAKDSATVATVMKAETHQEWKRISENVNKDMILKAWMETMAEKVIMDGLNAKFDQNKKCSEDVHILCGLLSCDSSTICKLPLN